VDESEKMLNDGDIHRLELKGVRMVRKRDLHEIPMLRNLVLTALAVGAHLYLLFLLPSLLERSPASLLLLPASLLLIITNGVLVHEAVHGLLFPGPRGNALLGRLCGILVGVSYDLQKYDHLLHHVHSSTRRNCPDVKLMDPAGRARPSYLRYLYGSVIGLYLAEFYFNTVTCFRSEETIRSIRCPAIASDQQATSGQMAMRQLLAKGRLAQVRVDGAWIVALHAASLYCFRHHLGLFVALFVGRAVILTVLDSFAHFKTPVNSRWFAKNIRLPLFIERWVFLNFNLHGVHHIYPDQSWVRLSALQTTNPLGIRFIYHQNLFEALRDKFRRPKYVVRFPEELTPFDAIPVSHEANP
jgi:fatty acid desaturase